MSMDEAKAAVRKTEREQLEVQANQEHIDRVLTELSSRMRHPSNSKPQR